MQISELKARLKSHHDNVAKKENSPEGDGKATLEKFNAKLEDAAQNREQMLNDIREKASRNSKRVDRVSKWMKDKREDKERSLDDSLKAAEQLRLQRLAETSAAAARHCFLAAERAKELKEKERQDASEKYKAYEAKLAAAAAARERISSAQHTISPDNFKLGPPTPEMSQKIEENKVCIHNRDASLGQKQRISVGEAIMLLRRRDIIGLIPGKASSAVNSPSKNLHNILESSKPNEAPIPLRLHSSNSGLDSDDGLDMSFDEFAKTIAERDVLIAVRRILAHIESHVLRIRSHLSGGSQQRQLARYPSRVFLASYMIANFPGKIISCVL